MNEELEKCKRALEVALDGVNELRHQGIVHHSRPDDIRKCCEDVHAKVAAILEPPPEFEEVEVVRWYNIYPLTGGFHLDCTHGFATKEEADNDAGTERIGCQDIRVKVKRPVKRPVVKEVRGGATWASAEGVATYPHYSGKGEMIKWSELEGKTGELIFRWEE